MVQWGHELRWVKKESPAEARLSNKQQTILACPMWHCCKNTFLSVARINHVLLDLNGSFQPMVTLTGVNSVIFLLFGNIVIFNS
jgi:hypothetical protein